jgi:hypothetical protein
MTPFLAPLLDVSYAKGPARWNDPEGNDRARAMSDAFKGTRDKKVPPAGRWETSSFADLSAWQNYFAGNPLFPFADPPQDAARDVLAALHKFDPVLDELRTTSDRPYSVFPIHYERHFNALLPHLAVLKGVSQIVRLRALARLSAEQTDAALDDCRFSLRLAESIASEPTLISQLVRIAMLNSALQPVWEGLARHQWTDAQLVELQAELARVKILPDYARAMRGERNMANALLDDLRTGKQKGDQGLLSDDGMFSPSGMRLWPRGWFYQNQVAINRLYLERTIPMVDAEQHRVFPDRAHEADSEPELKRRSPYNIFAALLYPAVSKSALRFTHAQSCLDFATVACALERYRVAEGRYPEKLDQLVPRFIGALPNDVITGKSLQYHATADGLFVLYSVGWNESDDGGEVKIRSTKSRNNTDPKEGDWVWAYPGK